MGRRKIEIKAIKDDRNRSVTFLKRKGGLFKKAHELSVLCNVDVAVVIFGQNRKLYEFSSGDIHETISRYHYYGQPHEHKGPADFADKDGGDDEEDDEMVPSDERTTPQPPHGFPQAQMQQMHHMRHGSGPAPSQSPPINNGMFPPQQRMSTPQPQHPSRPTSVNSHRRVSSNLVPQNHPNPQASQPFGYGNIQQNPSYYHQQQARSGMQMHSHQGTPQMQHQQMYAQMNNQHAYSHPVPPASQMQQMYLQEQRRQSMPPNFGIQQGRPQSVPPVQQSPPQLSKPFQSPPMPGSPEESGPPPQHARSYPNYAMGNGQQMFPPQWTEPPQQQQYGYKPQVEQDHNARPASIDVGSVSRQRAASSSPRPPFAPAGVVQRARSPMQHTDSNDTANSSAQPSPSFQQYSNPQASRVDSMASDTKRPRLAIQIPSGAGPEEAAETDPTSAGGQRSSAAASNSNSTPSKPTAPSTAGSSQSVRSGPVLPPPSPSAPNSANQNPLSAGATGPPNPFARPPPPPSQHPQPHALNTNLPPPTNATNVKPEVNNSPTPVSALPSRFMSNELLPSPGALFNNSDWSMSSLWSSGGMSAGGMNNITSPNTLFQPTPIRENARHDWPMARDQAAREAAGRMEVDGAGGGAEEDEERRKRKVISPTEGWDERLKRGNWGGER